MTTKFIHLNLHTEYSIIDGIVRPKALFEECFVSDIPAIALTDQSNLFALVKFYKAAVSAGVKPIVGVDIWLENELQQTKPFKVILLAQNQKGYQNILKIISRSYLHGQQLGIPVVKRDWLQELNSGLIVLSGGKDGDVGSSLLLGDLEKTKNLLDFWQENFSDRYYLEIQRTGREKEEEYLAKAFELSVRSSVPLVATNAVRFLHQDDFDAHEARVCIHSGRVLNDEGRPKLYGDQQYLRSEDEMVELFSDIPESLVNSVEIAKRCNVEVEFGKTYLPVFPMPSNTTAEDYFTDQAHAGLQKRLQDNFDSNSEGFKQIQDDYVKRLNYEIEVINQMGFASYFLIVADFINWSRKNDVPVGPGRGSGAGSLVAYSLGITNIDPIVHGLLFERFLNPERVSLPDFDVDFCMDGRDRVIEYVMECYGKDKVAQIITYGTMAARAVVRDVGRVLGYPYGYVDKIAKLIPFELGITLERSLKEEDLLQQKYNDDYETKDLIDLAMKLEGITRNAGKHAAGVVIAPSMLTDFMPLYCESDSEGVITQLDKDDVETIGLVKFDFLGLRTLTIIDKTVKSINKNGGQLIDIDHIPVDDLSTYELLQQGKTTAIFQFESRISRDLIKRFKPDCFSDVIALGAIIRPGVLQSGMLDEIIDRKQGRSQITYLHPMLEPILRPTYGVAIYQEQVMQMAQSLAGYSLGGADLLRRAMGKKKPEEMAKQRAIFIDGASKNEVDKHTANAIFDLMEKFAGYGFNKSHSAAYALISYQTAWLKTHYPAEFMASVLSSDMDNTDKVVLFLTECKELGLEVIPPCINISNYEFTVGDDKKIIYGLGAIKGVGQSAVEMIVEARENDGPFKDLFDLCKRVDTRKVNKRAIEALICAGALDRIGPHRSSQVATFETALRVADQHDKQSSSGQVDLFSELMPEEEIKFDYKVVEPWTKEEQLQNEKSVLGFYLSGHPIEKFVKELNEFISSSIGELDLEVGKSVLIGGYVKSLRIVNTKSGNRLAIVSLEDLTGSIDVTMFGESFDSYRSNILEGQLVVVEGEVVADNFSNGYRIRGNKALNLDQARSIYAKGLLIKFSADEFIDGDVDRLYEILNGYRGGDCPVFISYDNARSNSKFVLGEEWQVHPKEELLDKLKDRIAASRVCFLY